VAPTVRLLDYVPTSGSFRSDVLAGLRPPRKALPCKYFYDAEGARLFEQICELPEYYPTRVELGIMEAHVRDMASALGPGCLVIEYGSGAGRKTRMLLRHLTSPVGYVPIDISKEQLLAEATALAASFPALEILPVAADYTDRYDVPSPSARPARRVVYFPGSTIGNFPPDAAVGFLRHVAEQCGPGGALLIGVDMKKDPGLIHRAYNDAAGVTAAFNENLLVRINRELGAALPVPRFRHHAFYDPGEGRVEMHLVSLDDRVEEVCGERVAFERGESIWTESSYKYTLRGFATLAGAAGFSVAKVWTDTEGMFSVQYLTLA
jgi:dimethylhistidine N-methyltransferase